MLWVCVALVESKVAALLFIIFLVHLSYTVFHTCNIMVCLPQGEIGSLLRIHGAMIV